MKVTGFSFIKNAIIYDYPIVEAITSILPICDEFIVAVGKSDDDTLSLIKSIDKNKIKIVETEWDESLREGGKVLAVETGKAFSAISKDSDWAFYIQGDEVVHEQYLDTIKQAMEEEKDNPNIDGLLFHYNHFYGSYDYLGSSSQWYRHEIRVVKNDPKIYSFRDAQGFRKKENQKLNVRAIDAYMYHYGWVKEPAAMQRKQENFHKLWKDDEWVKNHVEPSDEYDYLKNIDQLMRFEGSHPGVMQKRIESKNWKFAYDISFNQTRLKDRFKNFVNKTFGVDFNYKNYIVKK